MILFDFIDYKKFISHWVKQQKNGGRGEYKKIADHLGVRHFLINQTLNEDRHFSPDQAFLLADYMSLKDLELEYFLLLVHFARSETDELRKYFLEQLNSIRNLHDRALGEPPTPQPFSERDFAVLGSDWAYIAVILCCKSSKINNVQDFSSLLGIEPKKVETILEYLIPRGILSLENNEFRCDKALPFFAEDSSTKYHYHKSWRLKGLSNSIFERAGDVFFTQPLVLSQDDYKQLCSEMLQFVEKVKQKAAETSSDSLFCLNVDFFGLNEKN